MGRIIRADLVFCSSGSNQEKQGSLKLSECIQTTSHNTRKSPRIPGRVVMGAALPSDEIQLAHMGEDSEEDALYEALDRIKTETTNSLWKTSRQQTHVQQIAFIKLLSERAPPCRVYRSNGGKAKRLLIGLFEHALHHFGS
jgi:hypothetical protein